MNDPMTTPDGVAHRLTEALEELESPSVEADAAAEAVRTYALASIALELHQIRAHLSPRCRNHRDMVWTFQRRCIHADGHQGPHQYQHNA